jgi:hypothetical protein
MKSCRVTRVVLDGVEESEALTRDGDPTAKVAQEQADGIARQVDSGLGTS